MCKCDTARVKFDIFVLFSLLFYFSSILFDSALQIEAKRFHFPLKHLSTILCRAFLLKKEAIYTAALRSFYEAFGVLNYNSSRVRGRFCARARPKVHIFKPSFLYASLVSFLDVAATFKCQSPVRCPANRQTRFPWRARFRPFRHFSRNFIVHEFSHRPRIR